MPRPIFIIGSPRSGTSVLTWAIGQHPNISLQPESNWIPSIADGAIAAYRIGTSRGEFTQLSNAHLPFESFMAHLGDAIDAISRECFERRVELVYPGFRERGAKPQAQNYPKAPLIRSPGEPKERWVDGTPEYTFWTYALGLLFPECKFIHILRRPDLVVNSLTHFENAGGDARNFDISTAIDAWMRYTLDAREAARFFGSSRLLRIDNADLASDGASVLARCFSFVGEPDCEHAIDALGTKMNSSKAADRQTDTSVQIQDRPDFREAQALYDELRNSDVPSEPTADALAKQRKRFPKPQGASFPVPNKGRPISILKHMLRR